MYKMATRSERVTRIGRVGCRSSPRNKYSKTIKISQESDRVNNNNVSPASPESPKLLKLPKSPKTPESPEKRTQAFAQWYKNLVEEDRNGLGLYLADGAVLKWFGRTFRGKKDIGSFFKYDMTCEGHNYKSIGPGKPEDERSPTRGRLRKCSDISPELVRRYYPKRTRTSPPSPKAEASPSRPNPSTPTKSPRPPRTPDAPVKRSAPKSPPKPPPSLDHVEADCILEFVRTTSKRGADLHKWERPCKLHVDFYEDPFNAGEYVIWNIVYSDNLKCKRNLMAAFDAVS